MSNRAQHGSLRKRKTGGVNRWLGSWWENGQRRAKTLGKCNEVSKTDAEAELAKLVQPVNEARGTVEYSLQGFTRTVVFTWYERKWKPSTAMTTKDRVDHHLLKELGNRPLSSFNRTILQDFLDRKAGAGLSSSTVGHLRWDLRQIFRMAVNDGLLPRNPAELLHAPTKNRRRDQRVLSLNELRALLASLPVRDKLIIALAGISGLRPGEILALQWHDIHGDGLHIERGVYRGIIQTPKTHHSARTAAISQGIRDDFTAWQATTPDAKPEDWVFPNENRNKPLAHGNYWRRYLKPTLDTLKLSGVTFQALRRTAVTLLNANGADATIVAAQCGHTVDVSTNVYNKVGIQRQQEAIDHLTTALAIKEAAA